MYAVKFLADSRLGVMLLSDEVEDADRLAQRLCLSLVSYATVYSDRRGQIRFPFG